MPAAASTSIRPSCRRSHTPTTCTPRRAPADSCPTPAAHPPGTLRPRRRPPGCQLAASGGRWLWPGPWRGSPLLSTLGHPLGAQGPRTSSTPSPFAAGRASAGRQSRCSAGSKGETRQGLSGGCRVKRAAAGEHTVSNQHILHSCCKQSCRLSWSYTHLACHGAPGGLELLCSRSRTRRCGRRLLRSLLRSLLRGQLPSRDMHPGGRPAALPVGLSRVGLSIDRGVGLVVLQAVQAGAVQGNAGERGQGDVKLDTMTILSNQMAIAAPLPPHCRPIATHPPLCSCPTPAACRPRTERAPHTCPWPGCAGSAPGSGAAGWPRGTQAHHEAPAEKFGKRRDRE